MEWASTIVRLPLKAGTDWLGDELLKFPPEFLLFAPHVHELTLRNDIAGWQSTWWSEVNDSLISLQSNEKAF